MDETESHKFDRIADLIEGETEWWASNEFDDNDLIDALRVAADALRRIGK